MNYQKLPIKQIVKTVIIYSSFILSIVFLIFASLNSWFSLITINQYCLIIFSILALTIFGINLHFICVNLSSRKKNLDATTKQLKKELKKAFKSVIKKINEKYFFIWRKRKDLYYLPWFLVIGFDKYGKFQLLNAMNSVDLNAEIKLPKEIAEYGCQWHITNRAMCLDISEKILLENEDNAKIDVHELWEYFLKLIKRYRYKKPINGILLVMDVINFQKLNDEKIKKHSQLLSSQLHKIYSAFDRVLPIHLIFTQCDGIRGYEEFYSESTFEEHKNTLGFLIPNHAYKSISSTFFQYYDHLIENIYNQLYTRLHREQSHKNSHAIFIYPLQIIAIKEKLKTMLARLFTDSHYQTVLFIKSLHFSMTEFNDCIFDFVSSDIASRFGLLTKDNYIREEKKNSLFVMHDFFRRSIVLDSNLELLTNRYKEKNQVIKTIGYTSVALFFMLATWSLSNTYFKNDEKLALLRDTINNNKTSLAYNKISLPALNKVLSKAEALELIKNIYYPPNEIIYPSWGMKPGPEIKDATSELYKNALIRSFFPELIQQAHRQLQQIKNADLNAYENLAVYLMLLDPSHMNQSFVKNWFTNYWEKLYPNSFIVSRLNHQLDSLLKLKLPASNFLGINIDFELINKIRLQLQSSTSADYFYSFIKNYDEVSNKRIYFSNSSDSNFGQIFGENAYNLFIMSFYSDDGYHKFEYSKQKFDRFIKLTSLVLNGKGNDNFSLPEVYSQLDEVYFRNYNDVWSKVLQKLNIVSFDNVKNAANKLDIITSQNSPLIKVLKFTIKNTSLPSLEVNRNNNIVLNNFVNLNELLKTGTTNADTQMQSVIQNLKQLDKVIQSIDDAEDSHKAAFDFAASYMQTGKNDTFSKLLQQAKLLPEPLQRWLSQIVFYSWQAILNDTLAYIDSQWRSQVWPYYSSIRNYFPFVNNNNQLPISKFDSFFCSNGIFSNFWKNYLQPFVDTNNLKQLSLKSQLGNSLPISNSMLNQLQHALIIHGAFCKNTSTSKVQFILSPLKLSDNSAYSQLNLYDHSFIYRHGPILNNVVVWPGNMIFEQASLKLSGLNNQMVVTTTFGPWALFKLFQLAIKSVDQQENDTMVLSFNLKGQSISYTVKANALVNPLLSNFFSRLQLLSSLRNK